jgi:hypothetical protein
VHVDQAEIVGTADDDAVTRGDLLDAALQLDPRLVAVGIAVRIQKEGRDAAASSLFDQVGAARRRNRKEGGIDFFRQRRQRRVAREAVQRGKPMRRRLLRTRVPIASGRSETPTMATDRGLISLSRERLMRFT